MTFVAMRLRVMWLADAGDSLSVLARLVDRYAFVAAIVAGSIGWWAFRHSILPLAICLAALVASIAAGMVSVGLFVEERSTVPRGGPRSTIPLFGSCAALDRH